MQRDIQASVSVAFPQETVDVALLRPLEANVVQRQFLEMIESHDHPQNFSHLLDCDNRWEMDLAMEQHETLRACIEDTAERIGVSVKVNECQLRRQEQRDCLTSDLHSAFRTIESSHITVIRDPTYAQVRCFRNWIRKTLLQRLVVLSPRERFNDLLEDFGSAFHTPYVDLRQGSAERRMQRIFLADEKSEDKVADVLGKAMDFSSMKI